MQAGPGRKPGIPNKISRELRALVQEIIDRQGHHVEEWLMLVAMGRPALVIDPDPEKGIAGGVVPAIDPDPAKALDLFVKLAEFAAPKQSRQVVANDPDNPITQPVLNITIGGRQVSMGYARPPDAEVIENNPR